MPAPGIQLVVRAVNGTYEAEPDTVGCAIMPPPDGIWPDPIVGVGSTPDDAVEDYCKRADFTGAITVRLERPAAT